MRALVRLIQIVAFIVILLGVPMLLSGCAVDGGVDFQWRYRTAPRGYYRPRTYVAPAPTESFVNDTQTRYRVCRTTWDNYGYAGEKCRWVQEGNWIRPDEEVVGAQTRQEVCYVDPRGDFHCHWESWQ